MIPRLKESYLSTWLQSPERRPLLIRGARQVGKSYLVRSWAKTQAKHNLVELNFEERPEAIQAFETNLEIDRILDDLNIITGKNLRAPGTILFLDEIQKAPKAITALRYFYEKKPELPVIAAGSLIEFVLETISFPVGRIESLFLHPISFAEYLRVAASSNVVNSFQEAEISLKEKSLSPVLHEELLRHLRTYFRIGGMPKAVSAYLETRDFGQASKVHALITQAYRDDFNKYGTKSDWSVLNLVFDKLVTHVAHARVKYVGFSRTLRSEKIRQALDLLSHAHLLHKVYASHANKVPLKSGIDPDNFKLLFLDIGLLHFMLGFDWSTIPTEADLSVLANGQFAEQFVGQEFVANQSGLSQYQPCYWSRDKKGADAEVDYLIERHGKVIPVEVKSGARGKLRSLTQYFAENAPDYALVFSQNLPSTMEKTIFTPLYFAGKIFEHDIARCGPAVNNNP